MRKTLLFSLLFLIGFSVHAQIKRCATYESMQEFRSENPNAETDAQFESWLTEKKLARQSSSGLRTTQAYTIPIIFHIIHNGEAVGVGSNISQAKVLEQLNQLNADFANASGSMYPVAANTEIQFCLATVGQDGKPLAEAGIERIDRNTRGWSAPPYNGMASNSYVDVTIMPSTIWNPYIYYNVWVLDLGTTLLGKATFPTSSTLNGLTAGETDTHAGVMVNYASVGSKMSPGPFGIQAGSGRTLTHETGHWLGLRHIWGDADCGDDFCNDTPTQFEETSGCPMSGTLNGCIPGVPKMFENYMDYTDDNCVNTFTNDQKARMQTVMANSPRRKELATANACIFPAFNSVRFTSYNHNYTETATVAGCPGYRDVVLTLNVYNAASGSATVNFINTGTATNNVDFTVIPSSVTYINGDNSPKTVTVRIWDDNAAEPTKTIVLGYTITGAGVSAASAAQTVTITVTDDDANPLVNNNNDVPLFSEDWSGGAGNWTTGTFVSGPNYWTISPNGGVGVTGLAAHITSNPTTGSYDYNMNAGADKVLISPLINTIGKTNARLSFKYKSEGEIWNGTNYDFGRVVYSFNGSTFTTLTDGMGNPIILQGQSALTQMSNIVLPPTLNNSTFYLGFRWTNDDNEGTNPPLLIDDIVISVAASRTEGQLGHKSTKSVFAGQEVYFESIEDKEVIARINNASANVGCITATVAQAGNGMVPITTNAGTFQRTQKVFTLVPGTANPSVTYQATFYFSTSELSAWGLNRANLKILQVQDGVNLSGMITGANAKLITPTLVNNDPLAGIITYTATFTGFSQFMLVSPTFTLPVNLITFEAKPAQKSIELTWSTAGERNNKGFQIERSTNGTEFTAIGWVNGAGTTSEVSDYKYTDKDVQANTVYYYRLNQVDLDNQSTLSEIRQAKITESSLIVTVSPNPATDHIKVVVSGSREPVNISLVNAKGQTVGKWTKANVSTPYTIPVSRYAKGYYTLVLHLAEGDVTEQVIIQ